jgi:dUTP pyrophosphatase
MKVSIKRLDSSLPLPSYASKGAVGFDLSAGEEVVIPPQEVRLIPTKMVIAVPRGYMLMIVARSSTPLKRGLMLANGVGIIDQDYCGPEDELKIEVYNFTNQAVKIKRGERLAQGILVKIEKAQWQEKKQLKKRTRGGFGSTGR